MRRIEVTVTQGLPAWGRSVDLVLTELTADEAIQTHRQAPALFGLGGWMVEGTIRGAAAGVKFYPKKTAADYPNETEVGNEFMNESKVLGTEHQARLIAAGDL